MRRWFYISMAGLAFTLTARADFFSTLDPNKMADVNGKVVNANVVNTHTLKYDSLPQPVLSRSVSPLSGQTADRNHTIDTKNVDEGTVDFPTVPSKVLPRSNIISKSTVDSKPDVATKVVPEQNANSNPRVIHLQTPDGQQDLKDEFQK